MTDYLATSAAAKLLVEEPASSRLANDQDLHRHRARCRPVAVARRPNIWSETRVNRFAVRLW